MNCADAQSYIQRVVSTNASSLKTLSPSIPVGHPCLFLAKHDRSIISFKRNCKYYHFDDDNDYGNVQHPENKDEPVTVTVTVTVFIPV